MEKLLNDQMLRKTVFSQSESHEDVLVATKKHSQKHEDEIENGNVQDYLEVFGELDDK